MEAFSKFHENLSIILLAMMCDIKVKFHPEDCAREKSKIKKVHPLASINMWFISGQLISWISIFLLHLEILAVGQGFIIVKDL